MRRTIAVSLLAFAPAVAQADQVLLKTGGEIKGEIVERRADAIVMEVGPGRITLPMSSVARVVSSATDLGLYRARAASLAPRDVAGWLDLAAWAQGHGLATQAREAFERVLAVDSENAAAHVALGHVRLDGRWVGLEEANRARGLVEFEGAWLTPEEQQARLAQRAATADESRIRREADARVREAEARAREAEARAQAAEADARQAQEPASTGIPYPWIFGPGYGPVVGGPFSPGAGSRAGMVGHGGTGAGHHPQPPPLQPAPDPAERWRHLKH
jgi:hypothetical protein